MSQPVAIRRKFSGVLASVEACLKTPQIAVSCVNSRADRKKICISASSKSSANPYIFRGPFLAKTFSAEKLDLLNADGVFDRTRYDGLLERFLAEDGVFVLDSGATAFLPFWSYLVESDLISMLRAAGRGVYVHVPIGGGEMLNDTLLGFKTLSLVDAVPRQ